MNGKVIGSIVLAGIASAVVTWSTSLAMSEEYQPSERSGEVSDDCFFFNHYYEYPDGSYVCWEPGGTRCMICNY
jgi:hypothetical protein